MLWEDVFGKFFPWVLTSVATTPLTGLTLLIKMDVMPTLRSRPAGAERGNDADFRARIFLAL